MHVMRRTVLVLSCLLLPVLAYAQGSALSGVVKDSSGAVLPGVTVEASSPVLIEKTRTAVTDSTGQYRVTELPPGLYKVAFTLTGFATVVRDGVATIVNPDVLHGWGVRPYDWQFGVSVQQEIAPRVALDVSYNRRSWGNFFFTDNRAITPQDFDIATITAPLNPLLPNGGGNPVTFYTRNSRTALGATDNYYTFASDYGDVTTYWHGVDVGINARLRNGLTLQGGTSTGRGVRDYCPVMEKLPETYVTPLSVLNMQQVGACAVTEPWLWGVRGLVSFTIPKIDVLVSSSFRSNENVQPSTLGRPLATGLAFQTVDLTLPGDVYPDRISSLDLRLAKSSGSGGPEPTSESISTTSSTPTRARRTTRSSTSRRQVPPGCGQRRCSRHGLRGSM
jgi:hypothetical protein